MSREPITRARIDELKGTVAHCVWSDLFAAHAAPPPEVLATIDEYLKPFAQYKAKMPCINCGTNQADGLMSVMFGGFTWGIAHGEGFCEICKWPARAYHHITEKDGSHLAKFTLILQYHPDGLVTRAEREKETA